MITARDLFLLFIKGILRQRVRPFASLECHIIYSLPTVSACPRLSVPDTVHVGHNVNDCTFVLMYDAYGFNRLVVVLYVSATQWNATLLRIHNVLHDYFHTTCYIIRRAHQKLTLVIVSHVTSDGAVVIVRPLDSIVK